MSTDISLQTTTYQVGNKQWLLDEPKFKPNVTLDISLFSRDEAQLLTIDATGGTYTVAFDGSAPTAGIAEDADAATVQAAIAGLPTVGAGNVSVSGNAGGPYTVLFGGALASKDVPLLEADDALLTGGGASATVQTITPAHYANGYIPSGTAIGKVTATGLFGPYDDTAGDGREVCYGFTYADVRAVRQNGTVAEKVGTGAVVSGAVSASKLPFQSGTGSLDANGKADLPTIRFEA
ncbi:head decoration protein [Mycobacterium canetti]|uniref:head decoration protein n=1 Tax=Mycobacterium canetti TaxID=78331 RepID=UPI001E304910|nr:head decoration protein [Mycobacterium canetti]